MLVLPIIASDQIPAPPQSTPILIRGATLHTVANGTLENADLLFTEGRIVSLGTEVSVPADVMVIEAAGKHVFPGLIVSISTLGLSEIDAVRATLDFAESGRLNPNIVANVAYNPDSEIIPITRSNGILLSNVVPEGGLISGQSAMMMLDGWTWEDATLAAPTALHLNWPSMSVKGAGEKLDKVEEQRLAAVREIDDLILKVRAYDLDRQRAEFKGHDTKLESMIPYIRGELPIAVHAKDARQIEAAVHWGKRQQLKIIIVGGHDAWKVTDLLKANDVPVVIPRVTTLPMRRYESYDQAFRLAAQLHAAGIDFSLSRSGAAHIRNLPYQAALAAAYGLDPEVALESITLAPARIWGVADRVGSLEVGKDATLFIADGDILDIRTNVETCFIQGRQLDLSDRHKDLYEKYQEKYRQMGILE